MASINIAVWNANGLMQHIHEVRAFLTERNIDIFLISETHFTDKSYIQIQNYSIYWTNHPAKTAGGGSAVIIKNNIAHSTNLNYCQAHIQATSVTITDSYGKLTIAALYCPPRHSIKVEQYCHFYRTLGNRFIAAGDYNAKHTIWGSRVISPKGRELFKTIMKMKLSHISPGTPTYWPSDQSKIPDVIDFCVTKGVSDNMVSSKSCLDLSSDHTPIIVTLSHQSQDFQSSPFLCNKHTNWTQFKTSICENLDIKRSLKTVTEVENAIEHFNTTVQQAAWSSTKQHEKNSTYC